MSAYSERVIKVRKLKHLAKACGQTVDLRKQKRCRMPSDVQSKALPPLHSVPWHADSTTHKLSRRHSLTKVCRAAMHLGWTESAVCCFNWYLVTSPCLKRPCSGSNASAAQQQQLLSSVSVYTRSVQPQYGRAPKTCLTEHTVQYTNISIPKVLQVKCLRSQLQSVSEAHTTTQPV